MGKITELQEAQKQHDAMLAELKAPLPVSINLANESGGIWGYVQFTPETGLLEIRTERYPAIDLEVGRGRQLLNALKELYE
jgi:hypothetical protein